MHGTLLKLDHSQHNAPGKGVSKPYCPLEGSANPDIELQTLSGKQKLQTSESESRDRHTTKFATGLRSGNVESCSADKPVHVGSHTADLNTPVKPRTCSSESISNLCKLDSIFMTSQLWQRAQSKSRTCKQVHIAK